LAAGALAMCAALAADRQAARQPFEVTHTERFPFQPAGTVRFQDSYGYLTIEGWDEPQVEVTVTKSTDRFAWPEWKGKADELFDQVRVNIEQRSDTELAITTTLPTRTSLLTSRLPSGETILTQPLPPKIKRGVTVEYQVHVPRAARLFIHHDNGYVFVSGLTGAMDVDGHTGDMIVMLADTGPYAIDARARFGRIASDISCTAGNPLLAGGRVRCAAATGQQIRLRMGRGSITIKKP
jgi:hypothetical protein